MLLHVTLYRILRLSFAFAAMLAVAVSAQAAIWLSTSSFPADNLPTIHADAGELAGAMNRAGPGGYYKLRAKFKVPYDPGYYQATDASNNNGGRLTGSPGAGSYQLDLYWAAYNASGVFQDTGSFYTIPVTVTPPASGNTGLQADFFTGTNFQTLGRSAPTGQVPNELWGTGGPAGTGTDNFSVRWVGQIEPLYSETYRFTTGSDDGMRVFVANMSNPLAGAYWDHGYMEASGDIALTANTRYQIRVEFFENGGAAEARLFWQSPSQQREIIPITRLLPPGSTSGNIPPWVVGHPQSQTVNAGGTAVFYAVANGAPTPSYQWRKNQVPIPGAIGTSLTLTDVQPSAAGSYDVVVTNSAGTAVSLSATLTVNVFAGTGSGNGLRGDYYLGTGFNTLISSRTDDRVAFNWGNNSPMAGMTADSFSVRWTGEVEAPVSGYYTFSTNNDDGVRLRLDNAIIINDWSAHPPADRYANSVYLTAGTKHAISLEFFENTGGANADLYWEYPSQPRVHIPQSRLYSEPVSVVGGWQHLRPPETATIYHSENTDDDGNTYWSSTENQHTFVVSRPGTLRVYTRGNSDTWAHLMTNTYQMIAPNLDGGGEGMNFYLERPISPGAYIINVGCIHLYNESDQYTVYVEFKPDDSPPVIRGTLNAAAPVGAPFSYQITADSNSPVSFSATGLPVGLTCSASGLITGSAAEAGSFNVQLVATNNAGSDTDVLHLTTFFLPPSCSITANRTTIAAGESVILYATGSSTGNTLRYLNIDQISPNNGFYGQGTSGTEYPSNNAHYVSPNPGEHTRQLTLTFSTAGSYRFIAAASDSVGWYYSSSEVVINVTGGNYALTVQNGTGSGVYPAGTVVAITANTPPSGQAFNAWSLLSGSGSFAQPGSPNTSFTIGAGPATIKAGYAPIQPPAISSSPSSQTLAVGATAIFSVSATGSPPLTYQWRKDGQPINDGDRFSGSGTSQLTIAGLVLGDAGQYDVVVTNAAGAGQGATSSPAVLAVVTTTPVNLLIHRP